MLNVATVTTQIIVLRNNVMSAVPIKRWIRNSGISSLQFLLEVSDSALTLQEESTKVKGIWAIIFALPLVVFVCFYDSP